ncbi:MAG: hypothetical protein JSU96_10325 [Acidobacteriota bacterium]|nr:MAG: hypothetical protein JSU96_10325 [Acidobacteriota bacterium]
MVTEKVGLGLTGWTDGNNRIQLQLGVHTQRAGLQVPRIPPAALDMATEADGWIDVPVNVTGTLETPRASIDTAALLSQISTKKGRYGQMARYLEPVE